MVCSTAFGQVCPQLQIFYHLYGLIRTQEEMTHLRTGSFPCLLLCPNNSNDVTLLGISCAFSTSGYHWMSSGSSIPVLLNGNTHGGQPFVSPHLAPPSWLTGLVTQSFVSSTQYFTCFVPLPFLLPGGIHSFSLLFHHVGGLIKSVNLALESHLRSGSLNWGTSSIRLTCEHIYVDIL